MPARSRARKRALDILFEADQRGESALVVLERVSATSELNLFVSEIVRGVVERLDALDDVITTYSDGWEISRMPGIDRVLARMGVWEIMTDIATPDEVVIDEIVTLASDLSTDESPAFLNGLLAKIVSVKHRISVD